MSTTSSLNIDVQDENVAIRFDEISDTRIVITDKLAGAGLVGSFMTKGLAPEKIMEYIKELETAAFNARRAAGIPE